MSEPLYLNERLVDLEDATKRLRQIESAIPSLDYQQHHEAWQRTMSAIHALACFGVALSRAKRRP